MSQEPDYTNYSLPALYEARESINRSRYSSRAAQLDAEIADWEERIEALGKRRHLEADRARIGRYALYTRGSGVSRQPLALVEDSGFGRVKLQATEGGLSLSVRPRSFLPLSPFALYEGPQEVGVLRVSEITGGTEIELESEGRIIRYLGSILGRFSHVLLDGREPLAAASGDDSGPWAIRCQSSPDESTTFLMALLRIFEMRRSGLDSNEG